MTTATAIPAEFTTIPNEDGVSHRGSRARMIAFGGTTALLMTESVIGAYWDLARIPYVQDTFERLEYPLYFATIIGAAKVAAVGAVLAPGTPRLKEWAYAGLAFVYGGAALSHLAAGDPAAAAISPLVFLGLTVASWALRPPARRDPKPLPQAWAALRRSRRA
ncbi:DoxX family protein [Nocardia bhagyanarayanae]|uniref:DoxX-like protein n=1 Tax=Nocardia bhagyanarayanae TaxID=1215925 RepID=A0A543FCF5_9NOCA|nr:DoxX family protein [Nocardia bhagyanarayanae]TQM31424.1 DoxX-like protein [Nocardia bhagyanarayanae]